MVILVLLQRAHHVFAVTTLLGCQRPVPRRLVHCNNALHNKRVSGCTALLPHPVKFERARTRLKRAHAAVDMCMCMCAAR
ncbi:hypothetical protein C8Q77DRAFT_1128308 [Trametes polyzona]|nr:hypothetical protein C8Q77DRAFT_1128308 [Trametes polyzona]